MDGTDRTNGMDKTFKLSDSLVKIISQLKLKIPKTIWYIQAMVGLVHLHLRKNSAMVIYEDCEDISKMWGFPRNKDTSSLIHNILQVWIVWILCVTIKQSQQSTEFEKAIIT